MQILTLKMLISIDTYLQKPRFLATNTYLCRSSSENRKRLKPKNIQRLTSKIAISMDAYFKNPYFRGYWYLPTKNLQVF